MKRYTSYTWNDKLEDRLCVRAFGAFKESLHTRDEEGKFSKSSGTSSGSQKTKTGSSNAPLTERDLAIQSGKATKKERGIYIASGLLGGPPAALVTMIMMNRKRAKEGNPKIGSVSKEQKDKLKKAYESSQSNKNAS